MGIGFFFVSFLYKIRATCPANCNYSLQYCNGARHQQECGAGREVSQLKINN